MGDKNGEPNLHNYKGIYFDDDNEKFTCPVTGAHFRFEEMCKILEKIRVTRGDPKVDFNAPKQAAKKIRLDTEESSGDIPTEALITDRIPIQNQRLQKTKLPWAAIPAK